ncbi:MAG: hypothetical protein JNN17_05225 [Verrucomicrobiaceae bacterium]|nr:hypothetical protein [Verrucomicrobiaceae bacterium]
MAGQHLQRLTPKQLALRDLEVARAELARETGLVAEEWSPRAVMARSFERYRVAWIAGAAVAGLAALKFITSSGRSPDSDDDDSPRIASRGLAGSGGLIGMLTVPLMAMGRKAVMNYGMQFVQSWLQKRAGEPEQPAAPTE